MIIEARIRNQQDRHLAVVATDGRERTVAIPARETGFGSEVNGGELLALALATCYCNDVYREAGLRGVAVRQVEVAVSMNFGAAGEPAREIRYTARLTGDAPEDELRALAEHTDRVAEIQSTLRAGMPVILESVQVESTAKV